MSSIFAIPDLDGSDEGLNNVVNALVQAVRHLGAQQPSTPGNSQKNNTSPGNKNTPPKVGTFKEVSRTTTPVTITDPVSGASVTFNQITSLTLQDTVTKEQWVWKQ